MTPSDVVTCAPATPVSTGVVRVDVLGNGQTFDFAHWTYNDLFSGSWTAYAFADGTFTAP